MSVVVTLSPGFTKISLKCPYTTLLPSSFKISTLFPYPSLNEVNYLAFGEVSEEYHNELYGFLQAKATDEDSNNCREKEFEKWLVSKGCSKSMSWIRIYKGVAQPAIQMTVETYIRNFIHHPENEQNQKYSIQELTDSIGKMKEIAQSYI